MRRSLVRKILVFGLVILFLGSSIDLFTQKLKAKESLQLSEYEVDDDFTDEFDAVLPLRPNGNGDVIQWVPYGSLENWQEVDDDKPDNFGNSSTFVYTNNVSLDLYTIENYTSYMIPGTTLPVNHKDKTIINNITIHARMSSITSGENYCSLVIYDSDYDRFNRSSPYKIVVEKPAFQDFEWTIIENPWTGVGWNWGNIDNLHIGIETCNPVSSAVYCTQVYLEINYQVKETDGYNINAFKKIQDAIDKASTFDKICVHPGNYYENIVLGKEGLELYSEYKHEAKILGSGSGIVVSITGRDIGIKNFYITQNYSNISGNIGIFVHNYVWKSKVINIISNKIHNCSIGIDIQYASQCNIENNTIEYNIIGIRLGLTDNADVFLNTFQCNWYNMKLEASQMNRINHNTFSIDPDTYKVGYGPVNILLIDSHWNNINNNDFYYSNYEPRARFHQIYSQNSLNSFRSNYWTHNLLPGPYFICGRHLRLDLIPSTKYLYNLIPQIDLAPTRH